MGKHSDFKKVKHHDMPGDIPKKEKIKMREKGFRIALYSGAEVSGKGWSKTLKARTRAVQKCRTTKDVKEE